MSENTPSQHLKDSSDLAAKVSEVFSKRADLARARFQARISRAYDEQIAPLFSRPTTPWELWSNWYQYNVDLGQRWILFWDTLRRRGNNFLDHQRAGMPPVLHFDYEMLMDGRALERPVNYALVRIQPPEGVTVEPSRRPYLVIDPRAGHGPGIGGFKDDSQVGVALKDGHPVYFVIFFPQPEPGQTMLDVCDAERQFVRRVRELHPDSPKPVLVGNCQGGWAAMMLAAANPDDTGPVVINGAPMSYWGGAWNEGEGDNPMRYAGGNLGGTWLASFTADLGNGIFDGAHLVDNFQNLNPANTFWNKYYHLFSNVDTEAPRFLDFERWWGGFYLMNREEIEWITQNLFVGNRLWSGEVKAKAGQFLDLKAIKSPIILFASMGDNITPPQQAFNWIADVYDSTEEIKALGQVIVGLLHEDVGHLGIFVSGRVAKKEHKQIVSVLKSIERLPPGLYGMKILETELADGSRELGVEFEERRLEDVAAQLNRFERRDEKAFEAVSTISEFNQRAYELFAQPLVRRMSNEASAKILRELHPLRFERWSISDLNPWLSWLAPAAEAVKGQRQPVEPDTAAGKAERMVSELISASLDYYKEMRDAVSEAVFFQTYGNLYSIYLAEPGEASDVAQTVSQPHAQALVRDALEAIGEGGYLEALARVAVLLADAGKAIPLALVELRKELVDDYVRFLPQVAEDQWRRIRGAQAIMVQYAPERALETLPELLADRTERERLLELLDKLLGDERVKELRATPQRLEMVQRIRQVLAPTSDSPPHLTAVR